MAVSGAMVYTFETCQLDPARFELHRAGVAVHVEPQVFEVLVYLVAHRDRVVPKTELLDAIWGDRFVSHSTLTSRLTAARPRTRRPPRPPPYDVRLSRSATARHPTASASPMPRPGPDRPS